MPGVPDYATLENKWDPLMMDVLDVMILARRPAMMMTMVVMSVDTPTTTIGMYREI